MGKIKTKFTKEFKVEAVKLVTNQGYTQVEAAKRLGIDAKNLSRWIKETTCVETSAQRNTQLARNEQEELQQLRKEVKRLRMEREILKKATLGSSDQCNVV